MKSKDLKERKSIKKKNNDNKRENKRTTVTGALNNLYKVPLVLSTMTNYFKIRK
jgi:hypothetical protein